MSRNTPDGLFEDGQSNGETDGKCPRVLVVDDERELADLFVAMLAPEFEATAVYDGEAAIEAVDGSVDVVLLDRRMPGYTGEEVLAEMRDQGVDCPVVMVTGIDPAFEETDAAFDEYLEKPVDRDKLKETVGALASPKPCKEAPR